MMRLQRTSVISALSLPPGGRDGQHERAAETTSRRLLSASGPGRRDTTALRLGTARTGAGRKTRRRAAGSGGITPCPRSVQVTAGQGSILTRPNSQHERAIERGGARCYPPAAGHESIRVDASERRAPVVSADSSPSCRRRCSNDGLSDRDLFACSQDNLARGHARVPSRDTRHLNRRRPRVLSVASVRGKAGPHRVLPMKGDRGCLVMRSSALAALFLLTSAATACAEDAWVLWRQFIPSDNPELQDARKWVAEPETKTRAQCEAEAAQYRALDPNKLVRDPAGRTYGIKYRCLPEGEDPHAAKEK